MRIYSHNKTLVFIHAMKCADESAPTSPRFQVFLVSMFKFCSSFRGTPESKSFDTLGFRVSASLRTAMTAIEKSHVIKNLDIKVKAIPLLTIFSVDNLRGDERFP